MIPDDLPYLIDVFRRLGQTEKARNHLVEGMNHVGALGDDGYGRMIRAGLEHVAGRLADTPS